MESTEAFSKQHHLRHNLDNLDDVVWIKHLTHAPTPKKEYDKCPFCPCLFRNVFSRACTALSTPYL